MVTHIYSIQDLKIENGVFNIIRQKGKKINCNETWYSLIFEITDPQSKRKVTKFEMAGSVGSPY